MTTFLHFMMLLSIVGLLLRQEETYLSGLGQNTDVTGVTYIPFGLMSSREDLCFLQ